MQAAIAKRDVALAKAETEKATAEAVAIASKSLRDLRVAEVTELDVTIENGKVATYRTKLKVSFKFEGGA